MSDCKFEDVRFFDPDTQEWGYAVRCYAEHDGTPCLYWRELFRQKPKDVKL